MKLTPEIKIQIANLIEVGESGRALAKRFNVSEGTISQIKKDYFFKKPAIKLRELNKSRIKKSREMQEKALTKIVNEKSELFVQDVLDTNRAIKFAVEEAITILNEMKSIKGELKPLLEIIITQLPDADLFTDEEASDLKANLQEAVYKIQNIFSITSLKLQSLNTVRSLIETSLKVTSKIDFIKKLEDLLSAYFNGLNELPEVDYQRVKKKVLDIEPLTAKYFHDWELTEYAEEL